MKDTLTEIDNILPQTQCQECTYQDCLSYAKAIIRGDRIDRCVPGGIKTLKDIASILQRDSEPYLDKISKNSKQYTIVKVREKDCIGCTKCIKACPVDAIIGAAKKMHTVIKKECTGCNLCIPACPVDCIEKTNEDIYYSPIIAKKRYYAKQKRIGKIDNNFTMISNKDKNIVKQKQQYIQNLLKK
ncbi:MAG: RnfABCDGE type electron transport complex subunit B [Legionellales bacterium]|nr:RnfABCDGE type electron transport complex subunit B [Legionellales bacterium]